MIRKTQFSVSTKLLIETAKNIPSDDFKYCLNDPTGNFFYDPWELKKEFCGTVWEELYNSLPTLKGEARLIKLNGGESYISHADIDDRWHLNISGVKCFLIDLDCLQMHPLVQDGIWYEMNAGSKHTASNFGNKIRYQLVVRHLLKKNNLVNPVKVTIKSKEGTDLNTARFLFDDTISPWLNHANKKELISDFSYNLGIVSFNVANEYFDELKNILPSEFEIL